MFLAGEDSDPGGSRCHCSSSLMKMEARAIRQVGGWLVDGAHFPAPALQGPALRVIQVPQPLTTRWRSCGDDADGAFKGPFLRGILGVRVPTTPLALDTCWRCSGTWPAVRVGPELTGSPQLCHSVMDKAIRSAAPFLLSPLASRLHRTAPRSSSTPSSSRRKDFRKPLHA